MEATVHSVSNHLIEVSGDTAVGEVYCLAYHRYQAADGEKELLIGGRYLDRYEQRRGEWRFSYRKIVADWNTLRPSTTDFSGPMLPVQPLVGTVPPILPPAGLPSMAERLTGADGRAKQVLPRD